MARRSPLFVVLLTVLLCVPHSFAVRSLVQVEQQAAVQQPADSQATLRPKPKPTPTSSQSSVLGELASDAVKAANEARAIADEVIGDASAAAGAAAGGAVTDTAATAVTAVTEAAADAAVAAAAVPTVTGTGAAMVLGTEAVDGIADVAGAGSGAEAADAVAGVAAADVASAATDAATDVAAHAAESAADEASDAEKDIDDVEKSGKNAENALLKDAELVWHRCVESEKLGEVCVGVFADSQQEPPLLFAEISLRNHTFLVPLAKAKACLDDQLLLNLLLHDPKLAPFAEAIKAIMVMEKLAAADVIRECVLFNNLSVTVDKPNDCMYISACPRLCSRLGCHHNHCLYSKDKEFECFKVRVPLLRHRQGVDVAVR
ncbi:hypothetical protein CLOP_g1783 [Closterium sp. NIES-67]|nr:hypothetical protein CLOP_g1783 [Closterium sp. NIES-67]